MDEPTTATPAHRIPSWLVMTLLVTAGVGLHLWVIARTEVAARDSIGFIRYALRLETEPFTKVLKEGEQPPGYPAVVLLVSKPVRAWRGDSSAETMVLSCQLASALMAVLSIVPTVLLGKELDSRQLGWLAATFFLVLPGWLRLTSDGLTEGTFLFWLASALWLGVRGLRTQNIVCFLLCGGATGMAYLTRPEGLEIVLALGIVLLGRQFVATLRQPWAKAVPQILALGCGLILVGGPYVAVIGRLSNKNTSKYMIGDSEVNPKGVLPQYGRATSGRIPLAAWFSESDGRFSRWTWAAQEVLRETTQGLSYFGLGLAVLGMFVFRRRPSSGPALAALAVLALMHALILCRMSTLSGYLSERHTLPIVFVACFPAAASLLCVGQRFGNARPALLTIGITVGGLLMASPALTKPLHYNRAGHKAAGQWLAKNITANDGILDPFNWSEFYAGRLEPRVSTDRPERLFVVLERNDNQHSRLPHIPDAKAKAAIGEIVYHWPEKRSADDATIVVYAVRGERLPDPATTEKKPEYRVGVKSTSPSAAASPTGRGL
jgi:hypothetical protein